MTAPNSNFAQHFIENNYNIHFDVNMDLEILNTYTIFTLFQF
jgi:hypothetical protein